MTMELLSSICLKAGKWEVVMTSFDSKGEVINYFISHKGSIYLANPQCKELSSPSMGWIDRTKINYLLMMYVISSRCNHEKREQDFDC